MLFRAIRHTCNLWKIFDKWDRSGKGLNDWGMRQFQPYKDNSPCENKAQKADTLQKLEKIYSKEVVEGHVGAYSVEDKNSMMDTIW